MAQTQATLRTFPTSKNGSESESVLPQNIQGKRKFTDWFQWEDLEMAGRQVKGWIVPQPLGIALIIVILGGIGSLYWRMSDRIGQANDTISKQNELLIRLDQRLLDKSERDKEFRTEIYSKFESVMAWQEVTNKTLAKMDKRN